MKKLISSLAIGLLGIAASFAVTMHTNSDGLGGTYLTFDGNTQVNINLSASIVAVGWYDYNNPTVLNPASIHSGILDFFRPGDVIGIWVETAGGQILTSSQTTVAGTIFASAMYDPSNPILGNRFYIGGSVIGGEFYSYEMMDSRWGHPPGQPLPGVLAALALCGVAAALKLRKNRVN